MKNLMIISILILNIFFSCFQSDSESIENFSTEPLLEAPGIPDLLKSEINKDFKLDFVLGPTEENYTPGYLAFNYLSKMRTEVEFLNIYPSVKSDFANYPNEKRGIQNIGLRYLRYHFLNQVSDEAVNETKFLLNLLIENETIDLDVLVDAYVKVEHILTEEEKNYSINYFKSVHTIHLNFLQENKDILENEYIQASGKKRTMALLNGKYAERISKMLIYCNDLINLSDN